jgi:hypothetical protein
MRYPKKNAALVYFSAKEARRNRAGEVINSRNIDRTANMTVMNCDVCFTPESGHGSALAQRPLSAISGHRNFLLRRYG